MENIKIISAKRSDAEVENMDVLINPEQIKLYLALKQSPIGNLEARFIGGEIAGRKYDDKGKVFENNIASFFHLNTGTVMRVMKTSLKIIL